MAKNTLPHMPQIANIVMVMFENRSLDNMLGYLYDGRRSPKRFVPRIIGPQRFDGILPGAFNNYKSERFEPSKGNRTSSEPLRAPGFDPHEDFPNVEVQLFADGFGNMPPGNPWKTLPGMKGFAYNYDASYETNDELRQVMGAYDSQQLPVLSGLARDYAVSDRWFSSVPSQTNPNRAFAHCGTSLGRQSNSHISAIETFKTPTIWNALPTSTTWGLYYKQTWQDSECYTEYTFPYIKRALANGEIDEISKFYTRASAGTLPEFTFLEPCWGYGKGNVGGSGFIGQQGDDYHPPTWVGPGEAYLESIYHALRAGPKWSSTLLIVTFDEHGGTWDHVPPTRTVQPDGHTGASGFKFDVLGVRVPTILASPYIPAGTVFRSAGTYDYDHTSTIATILAWAGVDPATAGLGHRVASAETFEDVLSTRRRSAASMPMHYTYPSSYPDQGGGACHRVDLPFNITPAEGRFILDNTRSMSAAEEMMAACSKRRAKPARTAKARAKKPR